jgi:hypothetical protein
MTPFLVLTAVAVGVHLGIFDFGSPLPDQPAQPRPMQVPSAPKPPPSGPPAPSGPKPPPSASPPGPSASTQPAPAPKPAPVSISAEVMILHGTNNNTGIGPGLGKIPALSKAPFTSYNSWTLLAQSKPQLDKGKDVPVALPTGRELRIVYKDVLQPQKPGDPLRYVIAASILKPDGKSFLPLVEVNAQAGEMFFVGGQEYKGGSLFIGIKVSP